MNNTVQPTETVYSTDADGIRADHTTVEEAMEHVKNLYNGIENDTPFSDPTFVLGTVYKSTSEDPIFIWSQGDQDRKEEEN